MSEMTTFERKVDTYMIGLNCPNCAPGELRYEDTNFGSPVTYLHKCTHCEHEETLLEAYPKIEYR